MAKQPKGGGITWTNETWNPIRGCSRVSEGCRNCYAERVAARFSGPGQPYEGLAEMKESGPHWTGELKLVEEHLYDPIRWTHPRMVFVNSMSDLFHEKLPTETIYKIFMVMWAAKQHKFQVLTKRAERMKRVVQAWQDVDKLLMEKLATDVLPSPKGRTSFFQREEPAGRIMQNVWFGVSVEDQATADERIPFLLQTPAAVRWVSYEPALGPVDFKAEWLWHLGPNGSPTTITPRLQWIVCGGESGPAARPMHPDWARHARDQCRDAGVPFFFKQWGEWLPEMQRTDEPLRLGESTMLCDVVLYKVGKNAAGDFLDSRQWHEFPK